MTDAKCYKCGGPVKAVNDVDGGYVGECLRCHSIQPHEAVNDPEPDLTPAPRIASDWVKLAKARMHGLIGEITAMDAKRAEVEAIARALTAYGEKNIPALPWKAAKAETNRPSTIKPWADDEPRLIALARQGVKPDEIAAELGRTPAAVSTRLFELRRKGLLPARGAA